MIPVASEAQVKQTIRAISSSSLYLLTLILGMHRFEQRLPPRVQPHWRRWLLSSSLHPPFMMTAITSTETDLQSGHKLRQKIQNQKAQFRSGEGRGEH